MYGMNQVYRSVKCELIRLGGRVGCSEHAKNIGIVEG